MKYVFFLVCDGLAGLPGVMENVWPLTIVQTSSVHNARAEIVSVVTCTGPGKTCANVTFEVQMQTCPPGMVAGFASASESRTTSAEMRFRRGRPTRGWPWP